MTSQDKGNPTQNKQRPLPANKHRALTHAPPPMHGTASPLSRCADRPHQAKPYQNYMILLLVIYRFWCQNNTVSVKKSVSLTTKTAWKLWTNFHPNRWSGTGRSTELKCSSRKTFDTRFTSYFLLWKNKEWVHNQ